MKLNINFNKPMEEIINFCQPLADWFERNQERMAYFELTHKGCLHYEDHVFASVDVVVLGGMANACFTCLETRLPISKEDKAKYAAFSIANIYYEEQEKLSENAKNLYYLDVTKLEKEKNNKRRIKK